MRKWLLALLFALAGGVLQTSAQTQTTLTGTITDPNGVPYSGARVTVSLVAGGPGTPTYTPCNNPNAGCQFVLPGPTTANAAGAFGITEWATSSILPAGSTYTIGVDETGVPLPFGTGAQRCQITGVTFAGSTFDVSGALSAACPALTLPFGAGGGSVLSVGSGNLPPLFTTTVTNPTTNPVINYFLSNAPAETEYGNPTNSPAPPFFFPIPSGGCNSGVTGITASYEVQASDACHQIDLTGVSAGQTVTLPQPGSNGVVPFVNNTFSFCGAVTTCTTGTPLAVAAGNSIVLMGLSYDGTGVLTPPSDSVGDVFVPIGPLLSYPCLSFNCSAGTWWVAHSAGGGAVTFTSNSTVAPVELEVGVIQYANVLALDQNASQTGGIGVPITSPAVNTVYPTEVLVASIQNVCGVGDAPGSGYILRNASGDPDLMMNDRVVGVTGNYVGNLAANCPGGGASWGAQVSTFAVNGAAPQFENGFWIWISNHSTQPWTVTALSSDIIACDGTSSASTTIPAGSGIWFMSDGTNWRTACGQAAGGGPGTGTQFALADWATTSTLGSIVGAVTGDSVIANNAAAPAFAPPGVPGSTVTASPYPVQCDSATTLLDRRTEISFQMGASAITMPDPTDSGCGQNFVVGLLDDNAGTLTVTRETAATFTVFNGSTATDGATSFTLSSGEYATLNSPDNANWTVRIVAGGGGGGGTIGGTTSATFIPFTTSADTLADSAFSYLTTGCPDGLSDICQTATDGSGNEVQVGTGSVLVADATPKLCQMFSDGIECSQGTPTSPSSPAFFIGETDFAMVDGSGYQTVNLTNSGGLSLGSNGDVGGILELFDGGASGSVALLTGGYAGTDPEYADDQFRWGESSDRHRRHHAHRSDGHAHSGRRHRELYLRGHVYESSGMPGAGSDHHRLAADRDGDEYHLDGHHHRGHRSA